MARASVGPNSARSQILSTYRLQFHKDFPFSAGAGLADYLARLGISHVYASPILEARRGSQHGYDVVSYDRINPELGGEDGFRLMVDALRAQNIGIILDIVPNHMAVGGADNTLWLDLLRHGRESRYAGWFDVDFDVDDEALRNKVLAPFLGRPRHETLANGELELRAVGAGGYAIFYGDHLFPIRPEDDAGIENEGVEAYRDPERLSALLDRQNFRLDWWRNAGDRINWRRFFDITQLAAIRMEVPAAFEAAHAITFRLYGEGLIDGVRVDHIDGLANPAEYCRMLRHRLDELALHRPGGDARAWLVVEKILAESETLPDDWGVDGTTGYDFMAQVSALQHEASAAEGLAEDWGRVSERAPRFEDEERAARREILSRHFHGQRANVVRAFSRLAARCLDPEAITSAAFERAVTTLVENLRVYRSYATGRSDLGVAGVAFEAALAAALREPSADQQALHFIAGVVSNQLCGDDEPARANAVRRLNQLTAPVAAKAVEDTAFYRYGRLLSRNDVGFDPGQFSLSPDAFHAQMQARAKSWPASMLATATHDHKRGEDVRARLAVLSELPGVWRQATAGWFGLNSRFRPEGLDPGDEYMLYQMLAGAWPLDLSPDDAAGLDRFASRIAGWWQKALREAKLRSSWASPNEAYEAHAARFVADALTPGRGNGFPADLAGFVAEIAPAGAANALAQLALKCLLPGVPDIYQGTEFWDFSLVDPDNRRPVDFDARRVALAQDLPLSVLAPTWHDGRIKQAVLRTMLAFRHDEPALFANGSYEPLEARGERRHNVVAFMRRHRNRGMLAVIARSGDPTHHADLSPCASWWADTRIDGLGSQHQLKAVLGPVLQKGGDIALADTLPTIPVAVFAVDFAP
jgi:(1->4)-alpha-D-glucan 1-alpha-D-glucosylmutase